MLPGIDIAQYQKDIKAAVRHFWSMRSEQSVTAGRHMDGFSDLLTKVCLDQGIGEGCVSRTHNPLPGYFRPSKDWDFIIVSPKGKLIAAIELKSQVGSFGNNFNNRTEEALGSAVDLWTALKWDVFDRQLPPWVGYLLHLEKADGSTSAVGLQQGPFRIRDEFINTSYLQRYDLFCSKLMTERHYSAASTIWSTRDGDYGSCSEDTSIETFLESFIAFLLSRKREFSA
jgi:hypothetical protein